MFRFRGSALYGAVLCFLLAACGGGGSNSSLPAASPGTPVSNSGDITVPLSSTASTVAIPAAGGYSGAIAFPAISGTGSLEISTSTVAPAGLLSHIRKPQSTGELAEFFYMSITPKTTMTLPSLPAITLTVPSTFATAGKQFYYALLLPSLPGVYQDFRTEGPGALTNTSVAFAASPNPYTITAGKRYTFAFYATTVSNTAAAPLLYVANSPNIISAYPVTLRGNIAPALVLIDPGVTAVASDGAGDLVVSEQLQSEAYSISTFAPGASGKAAPIRQFSGIYDIPYALAVDSSNLDVYAVSAPFGTPNNIVHVYAQDGTPLRSVTANLSVVGVAIDKRSELIVLGNTASRQCRADVYAPLASDPATPAYSIAFPAQTACGPFTYAAGTDDLIVSADMAGTSSVMEIKNSSSGTVVRQAHAGLVGIVASDASAANVFISDFSGNAVQAFGGAPSSFTPQAPIAGSSTLLNGPAVMTVIGQ